MSTETTSIDPAEIAKFEAMAAEWWDPNGKFRPLHMMNPVRLDYITRQVAAEFGRDLTRPKAFAGLRILDIERRQCLTRIWRRLPFGWPAAALRWRHQEH